MAKISPTRGSYDMTGVTISAQDINPFFNNRTGMYDDQRGIPLKPVGIFNKSVNGLFPYDPMSYTEVRMRGTGPKLTKESSAKLYIPVFWNPDLQLVDGDFNFIIQTKSGTSSATYPAKALKPGRIYSVDITVNDPVNWISHDMAILLNIKEILGIEDSSWHEDNQLDWWRGVATYPEDGRVKALSIQGKDCKIGSAIPWDEISKLDQLQHLYLTGDLDDPAKAFVGEILSPKIGSLTKLKTLSLYHNRGSGSIPKEIGNLIKLQRLDLSLSGIEGPIPAEIGKLTELELLDLSLNKLSGNIPASIYSLNRVNRLRLAWNKLTGELSADIGNMYSLNELFLANNELSGAIPSSIGNLRSLQSITLGDNYFTGNLPVTIGALESLDEFYCAHNRLNGTLPIEIYSHRNFDKWEPNNNILPQQSGYKLDFSGISYDGYESSDYSNDGVVITVQKSNKSNGINIVLMGDYYADKDMSSGGKYEKDLNDMVNVMFATEPFKTYRDYFNVYIVKVVSKNDRMLNGLTESTLNSAFISSTLIGVENNRVSLKFNEAKARSYLPRIPLAEANILVITNHPYSLGGSGVYGDGISTTAISTNYNPSWYPNYGYYTALHELGHSMFNLNDEYVTIFDTLPNEETEKYYRKKIDSGFSNIGVEVTNLPWKHFIGLPGYDMVGCFEGAGHFSSGLYRSEEECIMRTGNRYCAMCREVIVKKIKAITGESFSFSEFLERDATAH